MTKQLACVAAAIAVVAGAAHAQSRAKPEDARSAAPPVRASAFEGYRPYRDEALAPWREVNDEVRDFVFLINAYDVDPGAYTPKVTTMPDFNLWSWNSRVFPGIDHLAVRKGDRVRVRMGNLTMTNHPIHMHGYDFRVTCTDGGWVRPEAQWPEVTIDVPVGAMRAFEFQADAPGDWAFHCHKSHHTMNAMGHNVPTMIGVDHRGVARKIMNLVPDYMVMGERGMADMGEMEMPLPDNTLPMMTGQGPFGPIEMGGMFTVVKVREGLAAGRLPGPGLVPAPGGYGRVRVDRRAAAGRSHRAAGHRSDSDDGEEGGRPCGSLSFLALALSLRPVAVHAHGDGQRSPARRSRWSRPISAAPATRRRRRARSAST